MRNNYQTVKINSNIKHGILILFFLGLAFSELYGQKDSYIKKVYTTEDGLPSNVIQSVFIDSNNFIWTVTPELGLTKFNGYDFKTYYNNLRDTLSLSSIIITNIKEDFDGNLWIATNGGGVNRFDPETETFQRYMRSETDSSKIGSNYVYDTHIDTKGTIWLAHYDGLDRYDASKDRFRTILFKPKWGVKHINEDKNGNLWLSKHNYNPTEPICFNPKANKIVPFDYVSLNKSFKGLQERSIIDDNDVLLSLVYTGSQRFMKKIDLNQIPLKEEIVSSYFKDEAVYDMFKGNSQNIFFYMEDSSWFKYNSKTKKIDKKNEISLALNEDTWVNNLQETEDGSLWLATFEGLIHLRKNDYQFKYHSNILCHNQKLTAIVEDEDNFLWIVCANKLIRYDPLTEEKEDFSGIFDGLKSIHEEIRIEGMVYKDGVLWFYLNRGIFKWNIKTQQSQLFDWSYEISNQYDIKNTTFFISSKNNLFFGNSYGSLEVTDLDNQKKYSYVSTTLYPLRDSLTMPGYITIGIIEDLNNDIWIGNPYAGLSKLDNETNNFHQIPLYLDKENVKAVKNVTFRAITKTDDELFWIGTGSGLFQFNPSTHTSRFFSNDKDLSFNSIKALVADKDNNIWMGTLGGVSRFNPKKESFTNFNFQEGLKDDIYNYNIALYSKLGHIYFNGMGSGLVSFNPSDMRPNPVIPPIVLTQIKKFGMGEGFEEIKGANYVDELVLEYSERDFSVGYAALNYNNPNKNEYAYMLEGYNEDWVHVKNQREVTFTNLDPGEYTFKVKGSNNSGVWNEKGKTMKVRILAPWWATDLAYAAYALLGLLGMYLVYVGQKRKTEAKRLLELDRLKSDMYTQISHEFRTPLTIITGLNTELKDYFKGQKEKTFDIINRNGNSLLHLVDQLLELRKMEAGKMSPDYINANIVPYLKYLFESFESYAHTKEIGLHFIAADNEIKMDHDPEKLLVIVSNLLGNAIKFTPPGGNIYFQIDHKEGKFLEIRVKDTGIGINRELLPNIFERFYMTRDTDNKDIPGIGVGLALTKELVELFGGTISVASEPGRGSTFSIALPISQNATRTDQGLDPETIKARVQGYWEEVTEVSHDALTSEKGMVSGRQTILIVEDNDDVLAYLSSILGADWDINTAQDGDTAINMAIDQVPDIVLCDLMIPKTDGFGVLQALKEDQRTSHIPIVVLSAMADDASRMKGFEKGADAFLVKPFRKQELQLRLGKLVETRKRLQESYRNHEQQYSNMLRKADREFLKTMERLVLGKDHNTDYSIEKLCTDMGMSRTQLHNKLKALTGLSTSIFIRVLRLKRAKQLLETTQESVSEIAYRVGFNDPSYFTRCFTDEFGKPPKAIRV